MIAEKRWKLKDKQDAKNNIFNTEIEKRRKCSREKKS